MTYAVQVVLGDQSPQYYSGDKGLTNTPQLPLAIREDAEQLAAQVEQVYPDDYRISVIEIDDPGYSVKA